MRFTWIVWTVAVHVDVNESIGTTQFQIECARKGTPYIIQPWTLCKGGFGTVRETMAEACRCAARHVELGQDVSGEPAWKS